MPQELFQGNRKLTVIHLSGNLLEDLPEQIFKDLVHLEELDLTSNVLTDIQPETFKGTTYHPSSILLLKMFGMCKNADFTNTLPGRLTPQQFV
jgi:Leucine-rich repeat (LRR) protein